MTELTSQQHKAMDDVIDWCSHRTLGVGPLVFKLFGSAGTGKTTLAREVGPAIQSHNALFAAYTGKAASVLRSKGCEPATTVHSLLYKPKKLPGGGVEFVLNEEESPLLDADLLILDEVSMIDADLAADLESFGVPILVLGDPEQLEPIGGEGHYTSGEPDFLLTETHRFFIDGPVGRLATAIRGSSTTALGLEPADMVRHSVDLAMEHDQILCWRNATRWAAIDKIRARLGRPMGEPVAGDRLMCLTNNRELGVFNGEQFTVLGAKSILDGGAWALDLTDDAGHYREIMTLAIGFTEEGQKSVTSYLGGRGSIMYATFSQAITVHKAQGSQWASVYVVNEARALGRSEQYRNGPEAAKASARRFLYTAVTRAAERVTITEPRG